ncbi:MAG: hypothetical protein ACLPX9_05840 [Rhodomicrobium sp.]
MRIVKQILCLHLNQGVRSVYECLKEAAEAGLRSWADVERLDEAELEARLRARTASAPREPSHPLPDWTELHRELKRTDHQVTLALLWQRVPRAVSGRL